MGGWLILTQPGLAPDKKHQAALGAPTLGITGFKKRQLFKIRVNPIDNY
jgi:hypothetical protein